MMENVVVLKLADLDRARAAMRGLQRLHGQDGFRLESVAVIKGTGDGRMTIVEQQQQGGSTSDGPPARSTLGVLLGMLSASGKNVIGRAAGSIVDSVAEIADVEDSETVAAKISRSPEPPNTAVVAVVVEPTPNVLDRLATRCGAGLVRRSRPEVDRELAVAAAAVLRVQASPAPDRPIAEHVREAKDALKEAFGRTRRR